MTQVAARLALVVTPMAQVAARLAQEVVPMAQGLVWVVPVLICLARASKQKVDLRQQNA